MAAAVAGAAARLDGHAPTTLFTATCEVLVEIVLYGAGSEYALHSLLVLAARSEPVSVLFMREAEGALQGFLASKTIADLSHEFERKAPEPFLRDAEAWFQERRIGRAAAERRRRRVAKARQSRARTTRVNPGRESPR